MLTYKVMYFSVFLNAGTVIHLYACFLSVMLMVNLVSGENKSQIKWQVTHHSLPCYFNAVLTQDNYIENVISLSLSENYFLVNIINYPMCGGSLWLLVSGDFHGHLLMLMEGMFVNLSTPKG